MKLENDMELNWIWESLGDQTLTATVQNNDYDRPKHSNNVEYFICLGRTTR
jgi:hypothetical protein